MSDIEQDENQIPEDDNTVTIEYTLENLSKRLLIIEVPNKYEFNFRTWFFEHMTHNDGWFPLSDKELVSHRHLVGIKQI